MSKEILILGAGKIGRGVVSYLYSRAGYHITFYDVNVDGMRSLAAQGAYHIHATDGKGTDDTRLVEDFDVIAGENEQAVEQALVAAIARSTTVACCVYAGAFPSIAHAVACAVKQRKEEGNEAPLNVLLCVNALGAPEQVTELVRNELSKDEDAFFDAHVAICQVMVMAAGVPVAPGGSDPWEAVISANPHIEIDGEAWKGERQDVEGVLYVKNAKGMITRKVYCGNMRHAMYGFMGKHAGYEFIYAAQHDPEMIRTTGHAFDEAHAAMLKEFDFDPAEDAEWYAQSTAVDTRGDIKDPIDRIIASTREKLSKTNRFVGPALMCLRHNIMPFYLAKGAAYGLAYLASEEERDLPDAPAVAAFVDEVCGLGDEDWVLRDLIVNQFLDIESM